MQSQTWLQQVKQLSRLSSWTGLRQEETLPPGAETCRVHEAYLGAPGPCRRPVGMQRAAFGVCPLTNEKNACRSPQNDTGRCTGRLCCTDCLRIACWAVLRWDLDVQHTQADITVICNPLQCSWRLLQSLPGSLQCQVLYAFVGRNNRRQQLAIGNSAAVVCHMHSIPPLSLLSLLQG